MNAETGTQAELRGEMTAGSEGQVQSRWPRRGPVMGSRHGK